MDCIEEIETSLSYSVLARKNALHFSCAVIRLKGEKKTENKKNKGEYADRWGNSELTYFSSKRRLQHDFHKQLFL